MNNKRLMFELLQDAISNNLPLPSTEVEKLAIIIFEKIENSFEYKHYHNGGIKLWSQEKDI
jgi:hypothetical protein